MTVSAALAVETSAGERTVYHSQDFGWKAGQDITQAFGKLLKEGELKTGEELVLDHSYRISGTHALPDGFTLTAKEGAGLEVTDAKANRPLFVLGNKTALRNLTILYLDTPEMGGRSYKHGIDFFDKKAITASGKSDILIKNCRLEGMIAHHIVLSNCIRPKIVGCHVIGGFWAVVISGKDLVFKDCLFEKSSCDNVKGGADGALFENCVFQDTCRDGIDTTGGLNDTIVRNCIFRRLGCSGLDIKSHYNSGPGRPENVGILIEKCLFTDVPNGVVFTTNDGGRRRGGKDLLTPANIKRYVPHDIDVNDCTFGHVEKPLRPSVFGKDMDPDKYGYGVKYPKQGEHMRLFLVKDAYDIRYRDARTFGERIMPVYIRSDGGSRHLSREAADVIDRETCITGNILKEPARPPKPGDKSVPFACGPQPLEGKQP
jgi:hypothetical protein